MSIASQAERLMLDLINQERTTRGIAPLQLEQQLNESSEDHSSWMLATDTFSHTGSGGSDAGDRMRGAGFDFEGSWSWGENIAWQSERGATGILDDVRNLHDALMNSAGHRANILSAKFEFVGIGIEVGDYDGWDAVMVTQNFADTSAAVLIDEGAVPPPSVTPPAPPPPANAAPDVTAGTLYTAKLPGARRQDVGPILKVTDADGDGIVAYQIRDREGSRDNFVFRGDVIDATRKVTIDADDLDFLEVRHNRTVGETEVEIRAGDGQDWSDWETIDIVTMSKSAYADWV